MPKSNAEIMAEYHVRFNEMWNRGKQDVESINDRDTRFMVELVVIAEAYAVNPSAPLLMTKLAHDADQVMESWDEQELQPRIGFAFMFWQSWKP